MPWSGLDCRGRAGGGAPVRPPATAGSEAGVHGDRTTQTTPRTTEADPGIDPGLPGCPGPSLRTQSGGIPHQGLTALGGLHACRIPQHRTATPQAAAGESPRSGRRTGRPDRRRVPDDAAEAQTTKPTIVLVHGAWADSTSWDKVARQLKDDGYRTVTPELGLNSVAEDVTIVSTALNKISGKKVLVGHSYGGIVTAGASHGRTDVSAFVYAAALVPDEGDSIASLGADFTPSEAFGHLIFTGEPFASPAFIDPAFLHQYFAQDLSKRQAAELNAAELPLNFSIVGTPSGPVGWHNVPSWYAVSGQDRMIDPAEERSMAARVGADRRRIPHRQSRRRNHPAGITVHRAHRTRGALDPSEVTASSAPPQRSSSLARPLLKAWPVGLHHSSGVEGDARVHDHRTLWPMC